MIIHNSFAVSMHARIHQFGIFSSIGATPKQIRTCLLQEAAVLCFIPIIAGNLLGIVISVWVIGQINVLVGSVAGRYEAIWRYHPLVLVITLVVTILTIWISAWLPARKMSKLTPLQAIKNTGDELVHFLPVSLWKEIKGQIGGTEEDLNILQEEIQEIVNPNYEILSENRIQDKINNDNMSRGMMMISGGFCVLLAMIGIGNVFSNTLGFVCQRKREFARYMSIGLTSEGLRKLFCIEALVIAGRPVLITLPLTVLISVFMIKLSYLEPIIFIREAPVIPILAFLLAIACFVALAYYLSWKRVAKVNLTDALRDDTMI